MKPLAFDTETHLIRPGVAAPEIVCVTWQRPGLDAKIAHWSDSKPRIESWLSDPDTLLVGQNVAYDMGVIGAQWPDLVPLIFAAYEEDRVTDTMLRQKLLDIAAGCYRGRMDFYKTKEGEVGSRWVKYDYGLEALARRFLGKQLDKDTWRLRYGEFRDVSDLSKWPEGARTYPLEDARSTLDIFLLQEKHKEPYLRDQFRQARHAWWLHLASVWGLRTSAAGVEKLQTQTEKAYRDLEARLISEGLVRTNGTRDTKKAAARMVMVCERDGIPLRRTPADGVCLDADACKASGDEVLEEYAELSTLKAVQSKDVPMLAAGTIYPVHTRFDLAETGRTTSSKPNVQNLRRLPGIRECFIPRPGKVFAVADYDQLELRTLAQVCVTEFGKSDLAEALNAGRDPHTALAADILGISYQEGEVRRKAKDKALDDARQTAKVANFGFPGGLGFEKLVLFARKTYGVILTIERAKELKEQWFGRWTEMEAYFAEINRLCANQENLATVVHLFSQRIRGGATFCAASNSKFQGLGADASKRGGWYVSRACYCEPESPLFGSRIANYVHDELNTETDDGPGAHDAAHEQARLMKKGADEFLPDVPSKAEPLLVRFLSKDAFAMHDANGRLIPWAGHKKNKDGSIYLPEVAA